MKRYHVLLLPLCLALFLLPAMIGLAGQTWRTEAGSLAPLVLCLGAWTLAHDVRRNRAIARPGALLPWGIAMTLATLGYVFASAISMVSLMALAAWVGGVATFQARYGWEMVRRCAVPLAFLGLTVPLPYMLSVRMNFALQSGLSDHAVALAAMVGLDVARDAGSIAIGPYIVAVENACAGVSSTLSLVAIGLLFAHWVGNTDTRRALLIALFAVPIALFANLLRVVALLGLVSVYGAQIIDTIIHPLSGVLSFIFAMALLLLVLRGMSAFGTKGERRSLRAAT